MGGGSTGEMIPAAEISISRFLAVAVSWWSEGRLPGRVDFWKKEGEARYSCLEHPSAQEAQGAKGQGWGDGDGGDGAWRMGMGWMRTAVCVRQMSRGCRAKQEAASVASMGECGVVWCGACVCVRVCVCVCVCV
jgi:hypothetical protein